MRIVELHVLSNISPSLGAIAVDQFQNYGIFLNQARRNLRCPKPALAHIY